MLDTLLKFNSSPLKKCLLEDNPFLLGPGNSSGGELFEKFGPLDSLLRWCRMCKSSTKRLKARGTFTCRVLCRGALPNGVPGSRYGK